MTTLIFYFIFAYTLGSISSAIIVCKLMKLQDPRTQGSHNPGTTNVLRIGGKKAAGITLLGDALKGFIPVILASYSNISLLETTAVILFALLGHIYPIFFKFNGGKGVATFLGALFAFNYLIGISFMLSWLFVSKALKTSSLSALVATALTPIYTYFIIGNFYVIGMLLPICLLIFWTHRTNIKRLINKEESKI